MHIPLLNRNAREVLYLRYAFIKVDFYGFAVLSDFPHVAKFAILSQNMGCSSGLLPGFLTKIGRFCPGENLLGIFMTNLFEKSGI